MTGYNDQKLAEFIEAEVTIESFYKNYSLNPNANLIKGVICEYRVEIIKNPITRQARYLDKLVDELAKGKKNGKDFKRRLKF